MTGPRVVQIGNANHPFCSEVHFRYGLEQNGCEVLFVQENTLRWAELPRIVERHNAQMVMWTRTWAVDNAAALRALNDLRTLGVPSVSYHLDRWWGLEREYQLDSEPFFRSDVVVSPDGSPVDWAGRGINHLWMPPGVHEPGCHIGKPRPDRYPWDVVFVGSHPYPHPAWEPVRSALIGAFESYFGDRFKRLPEKGRPIREQDLADLYATVPVVLGDSCLVGGPISYWSDRVPETLGRGGLLIHPWVEGMEAWYGSGTHLLAYRAGDPDAALRTAQWAFDAPDQAALVRKAGQELVLGRDTYTHRMAALIAHVGEHFGFRPMPSRPVAVRFKRNPRIQASFHVEDAVGTREGVQEVWGDDYRVTAEQVTGGVVVDIGANVGAFTVLAAKLGARHVHAYEPHPTSAGLLERNVSANGIGGKVTVHRQAVVGMVRPVVLVGVGGGAHLADAEPEGESIDIESIDNVLAPHAEVALLKIDCEGAEYDIVEHISAESLAKVRRIVMEFHGPAMPHLAHLPATGAFGALVERLADWGRVETMGHPSRGGWIWASRY